MEAAQSPLDTRLSGAWSIQEDEALSKAVTKYHGKKWKKVALEMGTRSHAQCRQRWKLSSVNPELSTGKYGVINNLR
jgi:myb proto-oncogene protein